MAQVNRDRSDSIENTTFPLVREQLNDTLEAIFTINSGNSAPSNAVEHEPFINTSNSPATLEIKTSSGYITLGTLDPAGFKVGGVTPIASGGTGQTTASAGIAALLPSQTGNADKTLVTDGSSLSWGNTAVFASYAVIADVKTAGTEGGGSGSGSFEDRVLNTKDIDPDNFVTLVNSTDSNTRFKLPAGTYYIEAEVPMFRVGRFQARLVSWDAETDGTATVLKAGTGNLSQTQYGANVTSNISHRVTITSETVFGVQSRGNSSNGGDGFGNAANYGEEERYTIVKIMKETA
jgi:hypothetical protein|tara:strand:- start:1779 stop:2654 length:876 start_codon:yes stop_codon:yes gene_type:complete